MLTVSEPAQVRALNHPTRVAILDLMREPQTAAAVGRSLGLPRQLANYHLRTLAEAGLVVLVEERRRGNFIEGLYRAVARSFVVAPEAAWTPGQAEKARQQYALGSLLDLGGRIQRDAATLLAQTEADQGLTPAATGVVEMRFERKSQREAFMKAYMTQLQDLVEQHSSRAGELFRMVLAIYPAVGTNPADEERTREAAKREDV